MHAKIRLAIKILILCLFLITAASCILWFFIKPIFEENISRYDISLIKGFQWYAVKSLDESILRMVNVTDYLIKRVSKYPKEGEIVLSSALSMYPEIMQIRVYSSSANDELEAHNEDYKDTDDKYPDSLWASTKVDSSIQLAWRVGSSLGVMFYTKGKLLIQNIPFEIVVVWNGQQIVKLFKDVKLGDNCNSFLAGRNDTIIFSKTLNIDKKLMSGLATDSRINLRGGEFYFLLITASNTIDLNMVTVFQPGVEYIRYLFKLLIGLIVCLMVIMFAGSIVIFVQYEKKQAHMDHVETIADGKLPEQEMTDSSIDKNK